ncbi:MAG TPA: PQQ-binding-like beta-propeller repeat protein [Gemmataceae bacterium]|jgi:outer membrane protein assembly factor BamB
MFRRIRAAETVLASVGFLALFQPVPVWGQGEREPERVPTLRANASLVRKLDTARSYLTTESWAEVTHALQALLDGTEDALVCVKYVGEDGEEVTRWTGIRGEAARLLGALPTSGREFYNATYGRRAKVLLAKAREKGDMRLVAEVARRYPHTDPGTEATRLLGAYHLDRSHYTLAALYFERLMQRQHADELPPATLFYAALAFRGAGDRVRAERAWRRMAVQIGSDLRLGDKAVSLADLKEELDRVEVPGPARPAFRLEAVSNLEPRWTRPTVHEAATRTWLQTAVEAQESRVSPILPASAPIVAGGRVVYRSYRGLHAVDIQTGREAWQTPSAWSIDQMTAEPRYASHLQAWINDYLEVSPHVLFGNALLGTLSTDGVRVYAVDDLAVPPYRRSPRGRWRQEFSWPDFGPELTDAADSSRLLALDAALGKLLWKIGGRGGTSRAGGLSNRYFLGPPLPLDGRLYALTEKDHELALVCLAAADGALVWKQALAYAPTRLLLDPGRRVQAARPAYGEGILVCPTNGGMVVGVDLLTPGLAWAYSYRTRPLTQSQPSAVGRRVRVSPTQITAEWQAPVTVVQGSKVLFTAPDCPSIHCLSLRGGSPLWEADRANDDLYVAGVFAGKVLVVGKQACRALDLADGKELWQVETGLPSGRGVANGDIYYLPLKEAARGKEPAIYALDLRKGVIRARIPSPRKEVPGNLLLWHGEAFAQTVTAVTAYPKRKEGAR